MDERIGALEEIIMDENFWVGHIMEADEILKRTGQKIHPDVLTVHPSGNLIHVLLEEPPSEWGLIKLPDTIVNLQPMGIGYIIAAGPRAGHTDYAIPGPSPVGVISGTPLLLLGLHVVFGAHRGVPLRVSIMDRDFKAQVLIMSSKDIQGVDTNPEPLTDRATRRSKE